MVRIFLQPLMATCFYPPGLIGVSRVGPSKVRNITVSFTIRGAFVLGGATVPAGIELIAENGLFFPRFYTGWRIDHDWFRCFALPQALG
jgi:hypothetical protein